MTEENKDTMREILELETRIEELEEKAAQLTPSGLTSANGLERFLTVLGYSIVIDIAVIAGFALLYFMFTAEF